MEAEITLELSGFWRNEALSYIHTFVTSVLGFYLFTKILKCKKSYSFNKCDWREGIKNDKHLINCYISEKQNVNVRNSKDRLSLNYLQTFCVAILKNRFDLFVLEL